MRRWPLLLLLFGGLLFVASLYLPWQAISEPCTQSELTCRLFGRSGEIDGWAAGLGSFAAVFALLLVGSSGAALLRPGSGERLPLGRCGLLTAYLAVAVAFGAHYQGQIYSAAEDSRLDHHLAYGTYVGLAAGAVVLVAALGLRRQPSRVPAAALAGCVLVAFLLPWFHALDVSGRGIEVSVVDVAIAAAIWVPALAVLFVGGMLSAVLAASVDVRYGAWVGLGLAAALSLLALATLRGFVRIRWNASLALVALGAAAFVVAMFLPWWTVGGYSSTGWVEFLGWTSAPLVIAALIALIAPLGVTAFELATASALFVVTEGFSLAQRADFSSTDIRYGAFLGCAASALLLVGALMPLRLPRVRGGRVVARLLPLVTTAGYLVVLLVPFWSVLPEGIDKSLRFAPLSWLTFVGIVLAVRLFGAWVRRIIGGTADRELVFLAPVVLLALAALDVIRAWDADAPLNWGRGIVVALCLLLTLLGRLEQRRGLENIRVPEILRIDRL